MTCLFGISRILEAFPMRSRLVHAAVFICVFCLFLGYCEWWKSRPEFMPEFNAFPPPDTGAYLVEGAADETFNGVYLPMPCEEEVPCLMKRGPTRFLWRSRDRWHLSTEPGILADGYMSRADGSISSRWEPDGAPAPAPRVSQIPEFGEQPSPATPPTSREASPDSLATTPG